MSLKLKTQKDIPIKVLFYGKDGTGKSTNAERYCAHKGLKAVVLDIDETNFTNQPIYDLRIHTDLAAYTNTLNAIQEIKESKEYDTIIIDGVGSLFTLITPPKDPSNFYKGRTERWNRIMKELRNSRLNVIFIGQIDVYVEDPGREEKSNKTFVYLNGWVNEKYYCSKENGKFSCTAEKKREVK